MIDSLVANLEKARARTIVKDLGLQPKDFAYVTLHRPSNVDEEATLRSIMSELRHLADTVPVVFPMHPRTRKMCAHFGISLDGSSGLKVIDPIGYHDSICLTENARLVLTDSGGLQEESTYFRTPCLTLRPNTERPITISVGSNRLTSPTTLPADLNDAFRRPSHTGQVPPLWDGKASERILNAVIRG